MRGSKQFLVTAETLKNCKRLKYKKPFGIDCKNGNTMPEVCIPHRHENKKGEIRGSRQFSSMNYGRKERGHY